MLRCVKTYVALRQKQARNTLSGMRRRGFPGHTSRDTLTENKAFAF
jgi:hypothetical protein